MKKYILIFSMLFFTVNILVAQKTQPNHKGDRAQMMEKIKAKKVAYLTTKMDLSSDESAAFWPIYNAYEEQMNELKSSTHKNHDLESLSDAEIEKFMREDFEKRKKFLEIHEEAFEDYKKVLPMKKIAALHRAEREFTREVLHRYKNRGEDKKKNK